MKRAAILFTVLAIALGLDLSPSACAAADLEPSYNGSWQSSATTAAGTFNVHLSTQDGKIEGDIRIEGFPLTKSWGSHLKY